jgi:glycine cleavage system H protein
MAELRFTQSHEWISADNGIATIGITGYAAQQLGDVVYVELPEAGRKLAAGAEAAVVESVKAASEIYAPVAGEVTEANRALADDPAKVNADPEGEAWFFRMRLADEGELAKLMTKDQYTEFVKGL